jgi:heme A synthase
MVGMWLNLWEDVSSFSDGTKAMASVPLLDIHIIIALAILGNLILFVRNALKPQGKPFRPIAAIAGSFVALSIFSGAMFTFNGGNDVFSFTMEIGFVGLVASVGYVLFLVGRVRRATEASPP